MHYQPFCIYVSNVPTELGIDTGSSNSPPDLTPRLLAFVEWMNNFVRNEMAARLGEKNIMFL